MRSNYLALISILALGVAHGAGAPQTSPDAVMKEAVAALEKEGAAGIARFLHPEEQQRFKEMILGGMRSSGTLSDSTVKRMYGEEATLQSLQDMPADAFTELAMKRLDREPMRFKVTVLGSVREGDLVHYVLRTHAEGEGAIVDAVDVTTLRPWAIRGAPT